MNAPIPVTVVYYPATAETLTAEAMADAFARLGKNDPVWQALMQMLGRRLASASVAARDRDPNAPGRIEEILDLQRELAGLRSPGSEGEAGMSTENKLSRAEAEQREEGWCTGYRAAQVQQLQTILFQLGYKDPAAEGVRWVLEREECVTRLRGLCAEFGDNEWANDLYLPDVIGKHLGDHLRA